MKQRNTNIYLKYGARDLRNERKQKREQQQRREALYFVSLAVVAAAAYVLATAVTG